MTQVHQQTEPSALHSSAEIRLVLRHPEDSVCLSGQHLGWLALALREDVRGSLQGVLDDIRSEVAQLWSFDTAAGETLMLVVTRILHYELCDTLEIQLCGGHRLRECLRLLPELEQHARYLGCKMVELRGRRGWERLLGDYTVRGIALEKEL